MSAIARLYRDHVAVTALALLFLAMALWNTANGGAFHYGDQSSVPSDVDRFLAAVRAATPPHERLLVADTWQNNVMFVRALYMLQPRPLSLLRVRPAELRRGELAVTWAGLQRQARLRHAGYILFYAIPTPDPRKLGGGWVVPALLPGVIPAAAVRLRVGKGTLVRVPA